MRECKWLIKDFERVVNEETGHADPNTARMLNEREQSRIKELNSYVALKKQELLRIVGPSENKRVDLFDGPSEDGFGEENVLLALNMTNQQLMQQGNSLMDETDQALARSKQDSERKPIRRILD